MLPKEPVRLFCSYLLMNLQLIFVIRRKFHGLLLQGIGQSGYKYYMSECATSNIRSPGPGITIF